MEFVRETWYAAIWGEELSRQIVARKFLGEPILLYRKQDGTPVALEDRCPHRFAPLSMGKLVRDDVECLYHGLRFDCAGQCVDNPNGNGVIPKAATVRAYPVTERYGMVWIWMGKPANADPDALPDLSPMVDREHYASIRGTLKINASYLLLLDNLTDLSHASFLHAEFLQPREMARRQFQVTEDDGAIWARVSLPAAKLPQALAAIPGIDQDEPMDQWLDMRCNAPGIMVTLTGATRIGQARSDGYQLFGPNIITPETDSSTHYFWGAARTFGRDNEALSTAMSNAASIAFQSQDAPMLEAQQKLLGTRDLMEMRPVLLPNDTASARARRVVARLLDAERTSANANTPPA